MNLCLIDTADRKYVKQPSSALQTCMCLLSIPQVPADWSCQDGTTHRFILSCSHVSSAVLMLERESRHHGPVACGKNGVRVRFCFLVAMIEILTSYLDRCHSVSANSKANHGVGDVLLFLL
jgi:hypothetical protein